MDGMGWTDGITGIAKMCWTWIVQCISVEIYIHIDV